MAGKFKNHVVKTGSVTLSTSVQTQDEIVVPVYGDIRAIQVILTASATGTLTGAKTIENAIQGLTLKDKSGEQRLQNVAGTDLAILERYLGIGRSRTIPTTSGTAQSHSFTIPINLEKKAQNSKVTLSINPYSALATSGATGGAVEYKIVVFYDDETAKAVSEKIEKISVSYNSGYNTIWTNLPKNIAITKALFRATESDITSFKFTSDGNKEFDDMNLAYLSGLDELQLVDGHVSTEFNLWVAPFVSSVATEFNILTSTSGTIEVFLVENIPMK